MSDDIAALHEKLRFGASELSAMMQDLERESARLPYDWDTQERLKSTAFYSRSVERAVTLVLHDPVASVDAACLHELDNSILCVGQIIGASLLSILTQLAISRENIDVVVQGSWAMDEHVAVTGTLRQRLLALVQSVGICMRHIVQMRAPELYPWKERRAAAEITLLADTAQALETELTGLISGTGASVVYGRYLQLETILSSYEHFETYALQRGWAH